MDFQHAPSHTIPSSPYDSEHYDMYPPQSAYMSRSTSLASGSSFLKTPGLASDDSLSQPPLKAFRVQEKPLEPKQERGWVTRLFPQSWPIRLFLATVVVETIVDLAIQGDIYARLSHISTDSSTEKSVRKVVIYLGLFAFAHVFQLVIAIEAVWQKNTLQFLFLTIFNLLFFVYSLIEAVEVRSLQSILSPGFTSISVDDLTIISHVVIGVSEIAFIAIGWQIWKEFGWKVYKFLGADRQIKRIFAHYQIYLSLLRFDMFFCIGFSAQLVAFVLVGTDAEYYLTIGALPLGVLILIGGHFAARYENKWLMFSFMLGCICATVYFAFKLFRIYEGINDIYEDIAKSMITFAALSLFFLIVTFIWGCIVMHNFGRGLKEQMKKKTTSNHRRRGTSTTFDKHFPMTSNPNRMSIE